MDNSIDKLKTLEDDFTSYTAELKEGQFLGANRNYRLEKNLGVGGMGEVWLASELLDGKEVRKVVCKTLKEGRRELEEAQEKVLRQFRLIQSMNHQNICPIYSITKDPACGYLIVMGYADGGSYADWFAKQPKENGGLPLKTVCDVLRPIADALDFAHRKEVIHRDVKPENMMFTADGIPWLIDFGIAARLRSESMATMGQFASSGSVSYMAPEQKSGEFQTAQTDEYSLAMVALEFLTGSLSPISLLDLSPELQKILKKALAQNPSTRYATCREFIDALSTEGTTPPKPAPVVTPHPAQSLRKDGGSPSAAVLAAKVEENTPLKAGDRKILTADGIKYAFRWCPPGEFMMGTEPKYGTREVKIQRTWGDWAAGKPVTKTERYVTNTDELQHKVRLTKGFWLLETQVTQAMWRSVMGKNPSRFKGNRNPVENVSWNDCQEFCKKLSQKLGQQVQLPTEAQWEYACRAGTTGDVAGNLNKMAWYDENSCSTNAVGQKKPNAWGLYDMHGNVWEWCSDYYDEKYYSKSPTSDPENTTGSSYRVCRGGSWSYRAGLCRSANRRRLGPGVRDYGLGLRVSLVSGQD